VSSINFYDYKYKKHILITLEKRYFKKTHKNTLNFNKLHLVNTYLATIIIKSILGTTEALKTAHETIKILNIFNSHQFYVFSIALNTSFFEISKKVMR